MIKIICDQCDREILDDYIKVEGYGVFCDDDCLADALLHLNCDRTSRPL